MQRLQSPQIGLGSQPAQSQVQVVPHRVHRRIRTVAAYSTVDSLQKSSTHAEQVRWQPSAAVSALVDQEGSSRVSLPQLTFHDLEEIQHRPCPCGSLRTYEVCCGRLHEGAAPHHAAELARSRFSAFLLGNLQHLEDTMHPDSPDQARPQVLVRACHVYQTLQPRLLDMCHGMVPGTDEEGPETHVVASALLIQRDSHSLPHVYIEVDSYQLHEGRWMFYHKEHQMPTFGSFNIFWDRYGPGQHGAANDPGRYRFDLVNPRRTPTARRTPGISRNPTPQQVRRPATPAISRLPTPSGARRQGTPAPGRPNPTPQPRRTPALARAPTPSAGRLTPQPARTAHSHIRSPASPTPARGLPSPSPSRSPSPSASTTATVALAATTTLHPWMLDTLDSSGTTLDEAGSLLYMDDVDSDGEGSGGDAGQTARQLAAQQQMVNMLMDAETSTEGDSWLIRQSGFRYES